MIDYKNTPEGKAVRQKYADLLPLSRPEPLKPRMTLENRAKIFSPFAALRGYEDEISAEGLAAGEMKAKREAAYELRDEDHFSDEKIAKRLKISLEIVQKWFAERAALAK